MQETRREKGGDAKAVSCTPPTHTPLDDGTREGRGEEGGAGEGQEEERGLC